MGWFVAHLFVIILVCASMIFSGFGIDSWQYWVVLIGLALSNSFGRAQGEKL